MAAISLYYVISITAPEVPESCLPIGAQAEDGNTQLVPVEISQQKNLLRFIFAYYNYVDKELANRIVSLSMATTIEEDLVTCSSAGFLCM